MNGRDYHYAEIINNNTKGKKKVNESVLFIK